MMIDDRKNDLKKDRLITKNIQITCWQKDNLNQMIIS